MSLEEREETGLRKEIKKEDGYLYVCPICLKETLWDFPPFVNNPNCLCSLGAGSLYQTIYVGELVK